MDRLGALFSTRPHSGGKATIAWRAPARAAQEAWLACPHVTGWWGMLGAFCVGLLAANFLLGCDDAAAGAADAFPPPHAVELLLAEGRLPRADLSAKLTAADKSMRALVARAESQLSASLAAVARREGELQAATQSLEHERRTCIDVACVAAPGKEAAWAAGGGRAVNVTALAEERAGSLLKSGVAACFHARCSCDRSQLELTAATQLWLQDQREAFLRDATVRGVEKLRELEPWFQAQNVSVDAAQEKVKQNAGESNLLEYVRSYRLYSRWYVRDDPAALQKVRDWQAEQMQEEGRSRARKEALARAVATCDDELWVRCGLRLPLSSWVEDAAAAAADQSREEKARKRAPACFVRERNGTDREQAGVAAPPQHWKRDPLLYPDRVNVSFVVQYYKQPEVAVQLVERLYRCTRGRLGRGSVPNATSEMIVNVDEPSGWAMWMELWNKTADGEFLTPVFSHNLHESRGYNRGAAMAKGDIVVMMQDDDIPPLDCSWVKNLLTAFASWPRLGMVGMKGGRLTRVGLPPSQNELWWQRQADDPKYMKELDPLTGVKMRFVTLVDFGPTAFRRAAYQEIGGLDEGMSKKGGTNIWGDYQASIRMWLAGHQVAHLFIPHKFTEQVGGTHEAGSLSSFNRHESERVNMQALNAYSVEPYERVILEEVKRLNRHLLSPDPWDE